MGNFFISASVAFSFLSEISFLADLSEMCSLCALALSATSILAVSETTTVLFSGDVIPFVEVLLAFSPYTSAPSFRAIAPNDFFDESPDFTPSVITATSTLCAIMSPYLDVEVQSSLVAVTLDYSKSSSVLASEADANDVNSLYLVFLWPECRVSAIDMSTFPG